MLLAYLSWVFFGCDDLVALVCDYVCTDKCLAVTRVSRLVLDKSRRWKIAFEDYRKEWRTDEESLEAFVNARVRGRRRFCRGTSCLFWFAPNIILKTRQEQEARTQCIKRRSRNKTVVLQLLLYGESFVQEVFDHP